MRGYGYQKIVKDLAQGPELNFLYINLFLEVSL